MYSIQNDLLRDKATHETGVLPPHGLRHAWPGTDEQSGSAALQLANLAATLNDYINDKANRKLNK